MGEQKQEQDQPTGVGVGREQESTKQASITLTCTLYLTVDVDGDPLDATNQKRIDEAKADIWSLLEGHTCSGIMDERVQLDWDADWEEVDNADTDTDTLA